MLQTNQMKMTRLHETVTGWRSFARTSLLALLVLLAAWNPAKAQTTLSRGRSQSLLLIPAAQQQPMTEAFNLCRSSIWPWERRSNLWKQGSRARPVPTPTAAAVGEPGTFVFGKIPPQVPSQKEHASIYITTLHPVHQQVWVHVT